jgi:hypothetical protein
MSMRITSPPAKNYTTNDDSVEANAAKPPGYTTQAVDSV